MKDYTPLIEEQIEFWKDWAENAWEEFDKPENDDEFNFSYKKDITNEKIGDINVTYYTFIFGDKKKHISSVLCNIINIELCFYDENRYELNELSKDYSLSPKKHFETLASMTKYYDKYKTQIENGKL